VLGGYCIPQAVQIKAGMCRLPCLQQPMIEVNVNTRKGILPSLPTARRVGIANLAEGLTPRPAAYEPMGRRTRGKGPGTLVANRAHGGRLGILEH